MNKTDKLSLRKQQISVMRDKMAEQNSTFDSMRSRMFVLLGTEITLSGFLASPLVAIPYPTTVAGMIFLYMAISSIALSVAVLLLNYRSTPDWPSAMGKKEVELMGKSADEYEALGILYDDYRMSYDQASAIITPRAKALNRSLILFVVGVILLVVLKFGG